MPVELASRKGKHQQAAQKMGAYKKNQPKCSQNFWLQSFQVSELQFYHTPVT